MIGRPHFIYLLIAAFGGKHVYRFDGRHVYWVLVYRSGGKYVCRFDSKHVYQLAKSL